MLFEEGQATHVVGSGLEAPRDSRGFYPEKYADPALLRRLKALDPFAEVQWDRVKGRWVLYSFDPRYTKFPWFRGVPEHVKPTEFQETNALVCTWQHPDGSFRELGPDLVRQYEICLWRMRFYGGDAADYDREIIERGDALRQKAIEQVYADARQDMKERFWHIKANADKNIYSDPVKEPEKKIFSFVSR